MRLVQACGAAALVLLICLPGPWLLTQAISAEGLEALKEAVSSPRILLLLRNTIVVALGSGTLSMVAGGVIAMASVYWPARWRMAIIGAATIPILIPPYVFATAWVDLLGTSGIIANVMNTAAGQRWATPNPYNLAGVVFVLGLAYAPISLWCGLFGLRSTDGRQAQPLRLARGEWWALRHALLPRVFRFLAMGGVLSGLFALLEMSVPALLQVNVYAVEIYTEFNLTYDAAAAAIRAVPLALVGGVVWLLFLWTVRSAGNVASDGAPTWRPAVLESRHSIFSMVVAAPVLLLSTALPIIVLAYRSLPLKSYGEAFVTAGEEFALSLTVGFMSAVFVLVIAVWAYHVLSHKAYSVLTGIALFTFLLSGPVTGIGLIFLWNRAGFAGAVYDSPTIILLACAARYLGLALIAVRLAFDAIPRSYSESATLYGVSRWQQFLQIGLPAARPALTGALLLAFVWSFGELAATVLVCPPGYTMLSVRLHTLLHYGPSNLTAALSILSASVPVVAAAVAYYALADKGKLAHV